MMTAGWSAEQSWAGPTHPLLQLQQTIGNRAVGQMLRAGKGPVQRRTAPVDQARPQVAQRSETSPLKNKTGLPDNLKAGIENLSGMSMDDVNVHYNSPKPKDLQAFAYTKGTDIHVAPGQQKHLPHEAWHVVQQKLGRVKPTVQLKDVSLNDDSGLEREADVMGARAAQGAPTKPGSHIRARALSPESASAHTEVVQGLLWHQENYKKYKGKKQYTVKKDSDLIDVEKMIKGEKSGLFKTGLIKTETQEDQLREIGSEEHRHVYLIDVDPPETPPKHFIKGLPKNYSKHLSWKKNRDKPKQGPFPGKSAPPPQEAKQDIYDEPKGVSCFAS